VELKKNHKIKYYKYIGEWKDKCPEFSEYFKKQWLDSKFSNWQLYNVPPGMSTTNSPIESFNKILKSFVTDYRKPSIYQLIIKLMDKCIGYCSLNIKPFCWYREPDSGMINRAKIDIIDSPKDLFIYLGNNYYLFHGNTQYQLFHTSHPTYPGYEFISCTCLSFYKNYICKHCVALSIKLKKNIKGFIPTEYFSNICNNKATKVTPALVTDKENQPRRSYRRKN
jgi:hypothetical protein